VEKLGALRVLLASNNRVAAWAEVERLAALPGLEELLLAGNPLQTDFRDRGALADYRLEVAPRRRSAPCTTCEPAHALRMHPPGQQVWVSYSHLLTSWTAQKLGWGA